MLKYIGQSNTMFTNGELYEETPEGMGIYSVYMDDGVGYMHVDSDCMEPEYSGYDEYPWRYADEEIS